MPNARFRDGHCELLELIRERQKTHTWAARKYLIRAISTERPPFVKALKPNQPIDELLEQLTSARYVFADEYGLRYQLTQAGLNAIEQWRNTAGKPVGPAEEAVDDDDTDSTDTDDDVVAPMPARQADADEQERVLVAAARRNRKTASADDEEESLDPQVTEPVRTFGRSRRKAREEER
jgi:hypothetical protein